MIINQHLKGWEVVSHYTHGLLAGKIAVQLKTKFRPEYWEDVLTAIIEHDDHLLDFDEKNYLTEANTPLDFTLDERSEDDACEHARRVYHSAYQKSQMVALLVGKHLEFLYGIHTKNHSDFKHFFDTVYNDRKLQLKLYGWKKKKLNTAYDLMRFCDRCSLIICQKLVPQGGRKIEINKSIGGKRYFMSKREETIHITPWPFNNEKIQLCYEYRILEQPAFRDNHELASVISEAPVQLSQITFLRRPG